MRTESERWQFRHLRAEEMRRWPTPAERRMAAVLLPLGFVQQVNVLDMILDFFHPTAYLAVEIDGGVHKRRKGHDQRRDRVLWMATNIRTVRVLNSEIMGSKKKLDAALDRIKAALNAGREDGGSTIS